MHEIPDEGVPILQRELVKLIYDAHHFGRYVAALTVSHRWMQ
jgi:hypothetical protein